MNAALGKKALEKALNANVVGDHMDKPAPRA
jgi:hypothetical protein